MSPHGLELNGRHIMVLKMPEHDMGAESELTFDFPALVDLFSLTLNKIQKPYEISFNFFIEFIVNKQ